MQNMCYKYNSFYIYSLVILGILILGLSSPNLRKTLSRRILELSANEINHKYRSYAERITYIHM